MNSNQLICPKCGGNGHQVMSEDDAWLSCDDCDYESHNEKEWFE